MTVYTIWIDEIKMQLVQYFIEYTQAEMTTSTGDFNYDLPCTVHGVGQS